MCGIVGVVDGAKDFLGTLGRGHTVPNLYSGLLNTLRNRGPDATGVAQSDWYWLGFCRLSLVDLANGQQPVSDESGRVTLVFNGEIYNWARLHARLPHTCCAIGNRSEAQVLLDAYMLWGVDFVRHLDGDYAIAVLDDRTRVCHLFRDPVGVKPLYYTRCGKSTWMFASHPAAFFQHPCFATELDFVTLAERYITGFHMAERTSFQNVHQVPPGGCVRLTPGEGGMPGNCLVELPSLVDTHESFDSLLEGSTETLVEACCNLITASLVQCIRHYDGTGRVAVAFSGGIDSSLLLALCPKEYASTLMAVTLSDDERHLDRGYASEAARVLGISHMPCTVPYQEFRKHLPAMVLSYGGPASSYMGFLLGGAVRAIAPDVKVMLSGEGADELFLGYRHHVAPQTYWAAAREALQARVGIATTAQGSVLLQQVMEQGGHDPVSAWAELVRLFRRDQLATAHLAALDHGLMSHGIEGRVPFLSRAIIRQVSRLPLNSLLLGHLPKPVLRMCLAYALEDRPDLLRLLLNRPPEPAFSATRAARVRLTHEVRIRLPGSSLAASVLADYATSPSELFWLGALHVVFIQHRANIRDMTFDELLESTLALKMGRREMQP